MLKTIDLDILPDDAKKELIDFYEYLVKKYGKNKKEKEVDLFLILPKPVKNFSPLKREEIYGR